jgi:hypothetical protein
MNKTIGLVFVICVTLPVMRGYAQPAPETVTPESPAGSVNPPVAVSPAVAEVLRLAESGVGEEVVLAYIQNSAGGFSLSADQILYLRDVGLSSQLISAMLSRDAGLRGQPQPIQPQPEQQPPPGAEPGPNGPDVPVEAPLTPQSTEVVSPPPQVNYFYSSLSPYGTWVDLAGVGWCWQPSALIVNRSWQPYCNGGHWVYSDCGWFWQSDYSWGWAPFHYGRWQRHATCGWVWTPDTVWGPSWVVWRSGGERCGWAPLPPHAEFDVRSGWRYNGVRVRADFDFGLKADHFTFVGLHDFNERDLSHRRLAPTEVTKVYNNTTIVNNYTVNNTTVVNKGIPVERVASVARTPVHRATVREAPAGVSRVNLVARSSDKDTAVVYRPALKAPSRTAPVTVQKVDDRHPVIQHTPNVAVVRQTKSGFQTAPAAGGVRRSQSEISRPSPGTSRQSQPTPSQAQRQVPRTEQTAPRATQQPGVVSPAPTAPAQNYRPNRTVTPDRSNPTPAQSQGRARVVETVPESQNINRAPTVPTYSRGNSQYNPKGYNQAQEMRSSPPVRQSAPQPASQGGPWNSKPKQNNF